MMQQHQPPPVPLQSHTALNPSRSVGPLRQLRVTLRLLCHPIRPMLRLTALILQISSFLALIARPSSTCLMASQSSGALSAKLTWLSMLRSSSSPPTKSQCSGPRTGEPRQVSTT
ncbi:hypothetical protein ACFX2H_032484 [Malus domestica]